MLIHVDDMLIVPNHLHDIKELKIKFDIKDLGVIKKIQEYKY